MQFGAGFYWGIPVEWGSSVEGRNETPAFWIKFNVTHDADNAEGAWQPVQKPDERTVYLYLSEAAFDISHDKLTKLGFNGDFGNPDFSEEFKKGSQIECSHEEYNGKWREKWNLPGAREKKPVTNDGVRRLNALWKQKDKQSAPAAISAAPAPSPAAGSPPNNFDPVNPDDVPY